MKNKIDTFFGLKKNEMPIGAWVSPTPCHPMMPEKENHITDEIYKLASECGLNFMHCIYEIFQDYEEDALKALDLAEKYNLHLLVRDNFFFYTSNENKRFLESYNKYKCKKAFSGILVSDEPQSSKFETIAEMKKVFDATCSDKIFYVNLFPIYAFPNNYTEEGKLKKDSQIEGCKYSDYLQDYIDIVKPKFLSYDFYPLAYEFPNLNPLYFEQLAMVRQITIKNQIPFWNFVTTTTWNKDMRMPSKCEILFQVCTALAYGSCGIQYFTFDTPINGDVPEGERYQEAIIDYNGKPTERYYFVKEINKHIQSVAAVLMNSHSKGLIYIGSSATTVAETGRIESYGELKKIEGKHLLVGCFDYLGKSAYYIVNNNLEEKDEINLTFIKDLEFQIITKDRIIEGLGTTAEISLDAGEGVLIWFKN